MDISIIICTYNGADKIEKTLQSIITQKAICARELIVVDNASTDGTSEIVKNHFNNQKIANINWKVIYEPNPGLINARLAGMKEAASDIMLFCDDDNTLRETYVQTGYEIMKANPLIGALGGCGIAEFESEKPDWFDTYYHSFAVGPQADKDGKIEAFPAEVYGAGTFFRKSPLQRFYDLGFKSIFKGRTGKKLSAGDDVEWCYLLQLAGFQIWYDRRLKFLHLMPASRMNWNYYVKMKAGIAGGSSRFMIYSFILRNKELSRNQFRLISFRRTIYFLLLYVKHSLKSISFGNIKMNVINREVAKSKMLSYFFPEKNIWEHYLLVKKILNLNHFNINRKNIYAILFLLSGIC